VGCFDLAVNELEHYLSQALHRLNQTPSYGGFGGLLEANTPTVPERQPQSFRMICLRAYALTHVRGGPVGHNKQIRAQQESAAQEGVARGSEGGDRRADRQAQECAATDTTPLARTSPSSTARPGEKCWPASSRTPSTNIERPATIPRRRSRNPITGKTDSTREAQKCSTLIPGQIAYRQLCRPYAKGRP